MHTRRDTPAEMRSFNTNTNRDQKKNAFTFVMDAYVEYVFEIDSKFLFPSKMLA